MQSSLYAVRGSWEQITPCCFCGVTLNAVNDDHPPKKTGARGRK